jgi:hypothetical protein
MHHAEQRILQQVTYSYCFRILDKEAMRQSSTLRSMVLTAIEARKLMPGPKLAGLYSLSEF